MKLLPLLAALALMAGCANSPEKVTRSTLDIMIGTNHIKSSTPKEYKIKKLSWTADGFTVEGLDSSANVNAIEAQIQQAHMMQQGFAQSLQMLQLGMNLAAQHFGGGGGNQPPQVITNFVYVPVSAINTITNK
jgi:uncharacterized lipoprotein YajG